MVFVSWTKKHFEQKDTANSYFFSLFISPFFKKEFTSGIRPSEKNSFVGVSHDLHFMLFNLIKKISDLFIRQRQCRFGRSIKLFVPIQS